MCWHSLITHEYYSMQRWWRNTFAMDVGKNSILTKSLDFICFFLIEQRRFIFRNHFWQYWIWLGAPPLSVFSQVMEGFRSPAVLRGKKDCVSQSSGDHIVLLCWIQDFLQTRHVLQNWNSLPGPKKIDTSKNYSIYTCKLNCVTIMKYYPQHFSYFFLCLSALLM